MSKKDFEMVADVIKNLGDTFPRERQMKESTARAFAERFAEINPRFNIAIFAKACGLRLHKDGGIVHPADWAEGDLR